MTDIPDEIVQRMVRFLRYYERNKIDDVETFGHQAMLEARAIVALLPEPVDPDLVEARVFYEAWDNDQISTVVDACLAALKRGRELANQERKS